MVQASVTECDTEFVVSVIIVCWEDGLRGLFLNLTGCWIPNRWCISFSTSFSSSQTLNDYTNNISNESDLIVFDCKSYQQHAK